jgi:hypothetical protein
MLKPWTKQWRERCGAPRLAGAPTHRIMAPVSWPFISTELVTEHMVYMPVLYTQRRQRLYTQPPQLGVIQSVP